MTHDTALLRNVFATLGGLQAIVAAAVAGALLVFAPLAVQAQPTVDGDLSENAYTWVANEQDEGGFGDANVIDSIGYAVQDNNLYIAQAGTLEADPEFGFNGFGLFGNVTGDGAPTGVPAGDPLGIDNQSQDFHFINGDDASSNISFSTDFEVDFASAIGPFANPDSSGAFVADYTGDSPTVLDLGRTDQSGTSETSGEITFAYLNSEDPGTGAEWAIPLSAIGATTSNDIEISTFVVSATGYFSNEIIPGDGTQIADSETDDNGNPGNDATWNTYAGGPWHTSAIPLPVELASFDAKRDGDGAVLRWKTASETNNAGFAVEHAIGSGDFEQVGWVDGVGTTTEAQTYQFVAEDLSAGTHRFRLKQEDLDGSTSLSDVVKVDVRPEGPIAIKSVVPNPVRQTSTLRFTAQESGSVTVGLYDVLGRQVKTLHKGRVSAGQSQKVSVNASSLTSGVYFLRVKGEDFTRTERITVVR
jgi:hypothetical protein